MTSDAGVTAALVAGIFALVKVIEWLIKRFGKAEIAKLDSETGRQIRETYEKTTTNNVIIERELSEMKTHQSKLSDAVTEIAKILEKVASSQRKTTETLESMSKKQEIEAAVAEALRANLPGDSNT